MILDRTELRRLLHAPYSELQSLADTVRREAVGDHVYLRGLIEFSNFCVCNCRYCGLRRDNRSLSRYILTPDELFSSAEAAALAGMDTLVLQSGEYPGVSASFLADIIKELRARHPDLAITLSVGERPAADYALWRKAGAERFLIKHETANPRLYAQLHPGRTLFTRLEAIRTLKNLGYTVGSGFIIGVPGQTEEDLIEDLLLVQALQVGMCGAGPFLPQAETPFKKAPTGSVPLTLRIMALIRILLPNVHIPATTALASLDPVAGQCEGLRAGGNVLMPSFTPDQHRSQYRIYDHKQRIGVQEAHLAISRAGRTYGRTT